MECLGICWGTRTAREFTLRYAAATQIVKHRDEASVEGHNPLDFHVHVGWSGREVGAMNAIGEFHSHPYDEAETNAFQRAGSTDDMWTASDGDCDVLARDMVEVIACLQPLTTAPVTAPYHWQKCGLTLAGRHDLAYVTISAWYKDDTDAVYQADVRLANLDVINRRIDAFGAEGGA